MSELALDYGVEAVYLDFRWDSNTQCHIPFLRVEFTPVPANSPCDAKGWKDRDALAEALGGVK